MEHTPPGVTLLVHVSNDDDVALNSVINTSTRSLFFVGRLNNGNESSAFVETEFDANTL